MLEKKTRFFEKIGKKTPKNAKNRQKTPGTRDKEPDLFFFLVIWFFLCGAAREEVCGGHQAFLRCAKVG